MQGKYDLEPQTHCLGLHLGKVENFKQDTFGIACKEEHYARVVVGGRQQGLPVHLNAVIPSNTKGAWWQISGCFSMLATSLRLH